jgi:UDPglucose--hexose-1-phosphate uridylyltransferase
MKRGVDLGELRKDYILDRYVIIAGERAKRPDEFKKKPKIKKEDTCFFCPGNESMTPPEICRYPESAKVWEMRVFPNKFPATRPEGKFEIKTDNNFFTYSDAYGYHEVLVETPNHEETLADLPEDRIAEVFRLFKKRIIVNVNSPNISYVTIFKNHGENAGTSIIHTHCQLISNSAVPQAILEKEKAVKKFQSCPYCSIISIEKDSFRRCFENSCFVAFTPYASRHPLEIWVFPKRHVLSITDFNNQEFVYLAEIMKKILLKLKSINADYNFYLQYGIENMHFHIEITPRLSTYAGYELSTGTIINTMPPERAAEFYRG